MKYKVGDVVSIVTWDNVVSKAEGSQQPPLTLPITTRVMVVVGGLSMNEHIFDILEENALNGIYPTIRDVDDADCSYFIEWGGVEGDPGYRVYWIPECLILGLATPAIDDACIATGDDVLTLIS